MAKVGIIIAIVGLILLTVFSGIIVFFFGIEVLWSIWKVLGTIFLVALFIAILLGLAWYFFIKKHKFDVTAVNKKKLVMAGKIQCPKSILNRKLRLSGDRGHSWFNFGTIKGYLRIQTRMRETKTDQQGNQKFEVDIYGRQIPEYDLYTEEQDVFIVKRGMFPFNLFLDDDVVRVHPNQHDELIADVTLFGLNLIPISEYWYIASDYLDVRKIDRSILLEGERGVLFEMLKDFKSVVDQAVSLDSSHRKVIEEKSLFEIPQLQQLQGGGQK